MADTATETTSTMDQPPESGETYQGAGAPQDVDTNNQPDQNDQPDTGADDAQATDDADDTGADTDADAAPDDPANDPIRRIERENSELKGQLDVIKQYLAQRPEQAAPKADQAQETRRYKQALREFAEQHGPTSPQATSAKQIEKFMDALMADLEPRLLKTEQATEHSQRQLMRAAAKAEESEAISQLKTEFDATDAEIKAAREYAQKEYQRAAQAGEWPGNYQQLFERSIFRQRHTQRKQATVKDKQGEQKRLAAQVRADPTAGARPSNATGKVDIPAEALRDVASLERYLRKQGMVVDD